MARPATNHQPNRAQWLEGLYTPAVLLFWALYYFTITIFDTAVTRPLDLFKLQKVKDDAFSRFWLVISASPDPPPKPSELVGSAALIPPLLQQASGIVLEIGPGSGTQLAYIDASKIKHYHFAEPAKGLHASLSSHVRRAGLNQSAHTIHPCGGEPSALLPTLANAGLLSGQKGLSTPVFDTIICCRVLCSVPTPLETATALYGLLKPGGKLIVVEHVVNPAGGQFGSILARALQIMYSLLGWSFFVGDCHLLRDTEGTLKQAGQWVGGTDGLRLSFQWACLPYISGVLVKAGA